MKIKIYIICFFCFLNLSVFAQTNNSKIESSEPKNSIRCSTVEYEQYLQKKHPKRLNTAQFEAWINPLIQNQRLNKSESGGIITIPVVVHVVHSGQNVGEAPNIDDLQVQSQITVLNQDFRRMVGTPGANANPVGADTQIQFALAQVDPNGNPTNGIDRVYYNKENWADDEINEILKPQTIWDPTQYLNMWSVNFSRSNLLGNAQFPDASGLPGITVNGTEKTDGVVSGYAYFGSREIYPNGLYNGTKYDKGRTMTHELGHWLGLRHIWGDEPCGNDFCEDTPTAHTSNSGCPTNLNCSNNGNEMVENYMDYTDDSCMNVFTQNQKDRIVVVMDKSPRRNSLKTSIKNFPIPLFVNDAEVKIERELVEFSNSCDIVTTNSKKITIINRGTAILTNVVLNYNINGGANKTHTWEGSLLTHQSSTFNLPIIANVDDQLNINIISANNIPDQRTTNNSANATIIPLKGTTQYHYDEIKFNLQLDNFGSEVNWEFKNKNGEILFSGGPYSNDNPELITQTWQLKDNECYEFVINDSGGDGVCCDFGEGRYELKNNDNIIVSGGRFGSRESTSFSIKFVDIENDVVLFGNPLKNDELKIIIDRDFGKNITCKVYNISGKLVHQFSATHSEEKTENVSVLETGIYFLKIESDIKSKTTRFIKN